MRLLQRAIKDSRSSFRATWRNAFHKLIEVVVGAAIGFVILGPEKAMNDLLILALYPLGTISLLGVLGFIWNLWLAPFRIINDRLDTIEESKQPTEASQKVANISPANPDRWRHVTELKLYQVAELSGGVSPDLPSGGSNDTARAVFSELQSALRSGTLRGHDKYANKYTRIKRKELRSYFAGRDDYPEFLKD